MCDKMGVQSGAFLQQEYPVLGPGCETDFTHAAGTGCKGSEARRSHPVQGLESPIETLELMLRANYQPLLPAAPCI